jgi:hypothetical protein
MGWFYSQAPTINSRGLGDVMGNGKPTATKGIELFQAKCRNEFRRPENTEYYYAARDYTEAERKFVKFCLFGNPEHSGRTEH